MAGELALQKLCKSYGPIKALTDVSFTVKPGEVFGFIGANGAGKTTAMRIILGVQQADSGTVTLDGRPIDAEARRLIGYMPEERGLYPRMKVGEQLVYLAQLHGMDRPAALAAMEKWTERLGVAARRQDEVQNLSLGNQQRVQLAAALVHPSRVLVLDEPFSGLDPIAVDVMSGVLRERADAGVPVVFSSHQLDLMDRICDAVGIIKSGAMVETGPITQLRRQGQRHWAIDAPQAPSDWASTIPGVRVVSAAGTRLTVSLEPTVDPQTLLAAGLATGPVTEFAEVLPTLTELFRDVVSHSDSERRSMPVAGAEPDLMAKSGGMRIGVGQPGWRRRLFARLFGGRKAS